MLKLEVKSELTILERQAIEHLIYGVWRFEAEATHEVEMIKDRVETVHDPLDNNAVHVLIRDEHRLVGYGRVTTFESYGHMAATSKEIPHVNMQPPGQCAFMSRLVVHPRWRGQGIGSLIGETRIKAAKDQGVETVYGCAVGRQRQKQLAHAGFVSLQNIENFKTPWYITTREVCLMSLATRDYFNSDVKSASRPYGALASASL
jgi:GNAT superfamily N-acetyltransferase